MELCRVELREIVQLRVEEDVVEPDIGQQDNRAVLTGRPPGGKAKEGFLILLLVGD
jgi:ribosomal protein S14